jgi:hypothetical protein
MNTTNRPVELPPPDVDDTAVVENLPARAPRRRTKKTKKTKKKDTRCSRTSL